MKFEIYPTAKYRSDVKLAKRRGYDLSLLTDVVCILASGEPLPKRYLDHPLSGNYNGYRECHVTSDWLLIYKIENNRLVLILARTGTHSDLFKK